MNIEIELELEEIEENKKEDVDWLIIFGYLAVWVFWHHKARLPELSAIYDYVRRQQTKTSKSELLKRRTILKY